jgi:hypothetical protein
MDRHRRKAFELGHLTGTADTGLTVDGTYVTSAHQHHPLSGCAPRHTAQYLLSHGSDKTIRQTVIGTPLASLDAGLG